MGIRDWFKKKSEPAPTPPPPPPSLPTGGTYTPSTGVYIAPSGLGYSTATPPPSAITVTSPTTPRPSGGGGYSYVEPTTGKGYEVSPTGVKTEVTPSIQKQAAMDVGMPVSTISKAFPVTGIKPAVSYLKQTFRRDPYGAIKGAGQIAVGGIKRDITKAEEEKFKERVETAGGTWGVSAADRAAALRGYSGTATEFGYTETPNAVLIKQATMGDQAAAVAYSDRLEQRNEANIKVDILKVQKENTNKINNYVGQIQTKINTGEITYDQGVEYVTTRQEILEKESNTKLTNKWNKKVESQQEYLDKIVRKGRISRIVLTTAGAVVAGAVVAPLAAGASAGVRTALAVGGGAAMYRPVKTLTTGLIAGTATGLDVAELVVPITGFVAGGTLGMRIAGIRGITVDTKLNTALKTAEVKSFETVKFSSETQIKALKIPELQKAELIRQFNLGESVGYKKWKLTNKDPKLRAYLNEKLPNTEIISIGRTQSLGNFYEANTLLKVKTGVGKTEYVELTAGQTRGVYLPKEKVMVSETIAAKAELGKPITEIAKTIQVTKPVSKYFIEEGQLKRMIGGETYSFEGMKIKAPPKKQITFKDLMEVRKAEVERYPSAKTRTGEIQKATKVKIVEAALLEEEAGAGFGITGKNIKFITEQASDVLTQVPKPFEFERAPSTRTMKPFDIAKDLGLKGIEKPPVKVSQILKQIEKKAPIFDFEAPQIQKQIKESLFKAAEKVKVREELPRKVISGLDLQQGKIELSQKELSGISETSVLDLEKLQQQVKVKEKERQKGRGVVIPYSPVNLANIPMQLDKIISAQTQPQRQALRLIQPSVLKTPQMTIPISSFSIISRPIISRPIKPIIPYFPTRRIPERRKGFKQFLKKRKKAEARYTTSLGAAAFQVKPIKISRKEYKRLSKRIYTGAETRPVLEISDEGKTIRKQLEKVNF